MYPFGMKVRVKANIRPVYITWVDEINVKSKAIGGGYFPHTITKKKLPQQEMRQVDPGGYKSELTGQALAQSRSVPQDGKRHRRLRRYEHNSTGVNSIGVIVGWTWKTEGRFEKDDINFLVENRRQWGHQVALNNYFGTNHAWTTDVVFCLFDDLDPFGL